MQVFSQEKKNEGLKETNLCNMLDLIRLIYLRILGAGEGNFLEGKGFGIEENVETEYFDSQLNCRQFTAQTYKIKSNIQFKHMGMTMANTISGK